MQRREKPDRVRRSTQDGGDLPVSTWCTSMSMTYLSNNYTKRYFEWQCCITWLSFKIFYMVRDSTNIRGSLKTIVFSSMGRGGVGVSTVLTDLFVYNDSERFYYNRDVIFQRVSWFQWIWKSECSLSRSVQTHDWMISSFFYFSALHIHVKRLHRHPTYM